MEASSPESLDLLEGVAERIPYRAFLPFLGGAVILAFSYGASFMLPDALRAAGSSPAIAGSMIGAGTLATLAGSLVAGRMAQSVGLMPPIVSAAVITGLALICFAGVGVAGEWTGYLGGMLLGLGWAIAYILMPVQIIQCIGPAARLEALMLLSGSQMVGIGLSAPIGRILATWFGSNSRTFAFDALLCGVAALLLTMAARELRSVRQQPLKMVALNVPAVRAVLCSKTAVPVVMIGLAACSFAGLSIFQSLLATAHNVPPEAFFLTFTATTVTLRFSAASRIGKLPLPWLALVLALAMLLGLVGLAASGGSLFAWVAATFVFSVGYGLNYSTLNALVVNLAEQRSISVPVTSQVFTIGYFVGLFGFPLIAAQVIAHAGVGSILTVLAAIAICNVGVAVTLALRPVAKLNTPLP